MSTSMNLLPPDTSGGKQQEYKNLCKKLRLYNEAYAEGNALVTDQQYDNLFRRMQRLLATSPDLIDLDDFPESIGYNRPNEDDYTLPVKMYSTDNLYTFEEYFSFVKKYLTLGKLIVTEKIDGIALCLIIRDGKLVNISTRGNGLVGKLLNHLKLLFFSNNFLPGNYVIQGEFYATRGILAKEPSYRNLQSAANGARQRTRYCPWLFPFVKFAAYNYIPENDDMSLSYTQRLDILKEMKFDTVNVVDTYQYPMSKTHMLVLYQWLMKMYDKRKHLDYDIDGYVIRFDSTELEKLAGETKRTMKAVQAIKFQTCFAVSTVRDVINTKGIKGKPSAVVIIDEVVLNGKRISRVKLPTLTKLPEIGQSCRIVLSGMTVPVIEF